MSGHIVNDFKDLRKLIGQVTKDQPAKTQYQQQAEKMGYRPEAEAQPKDDKGDRGIARTLGKKHAGEDDIKKAYMKLGRAAQGSVEYQRKLQLLAAYTQQLQHFKKIESYYTIKSITPKIGFTTHLFFLRNKLRRLEICEISE